MFDELNELSHIIEKELKLTFLPYGWMSDSPGFRTTILMNSKKLREVEDLLIKFGYEITGWDTNNSYPDGVYTTYFIVYVKKRELIINELEKMETKDYLNDFPEMNNNKTLRNAVKQYLNERCIEIDTIKIPAENFIKVHVKYPIKELNKFYLSNLPNFLVYKEGKNVDVYLYGDVDVFIFHLDAKDIEMD